MKHCSGMGRFWGARGVLLAPGRAEAFTVLKPGFIGQSPVTN